MSRTGDFHTAYGSARVTPAGYLYNVLVDEKHRGQGHGHELLQSVTADADSRGQVLYTQARPELHGFYGKHGFVPSDEQVGLGDLPSLRRDPKQSD